MKDDKPWYEKVSIWITIGAGICTILGISVLSGKSMFKDDEADDPTINFENNEIGDQSTVIIGDGNTINYGSTDSENIEKSQSDEFSVTVSYNPNTPQTSLSGVNILVNAKTTFPAECVTISAISDDDKTEPMDMHGGKYEWNFIANFYIKGTYTVIVTAYDYEGNEVSDSFEYIY